MDGTLKERIKDCVQPMMKTVMVDIVFKVIKMDPTGLLWGDRLDGTYTFEQAQTACDNVTKDQGYPSIPGVRGRWRLPTAEEFARIGPESSYDFNEKRPRPSIHEDIHGLEIWRELPHPNHEYWSSSPFGRDQAWSFGVGGSLFPFPRDIGLRVRCVARP